MKKTLITILLFGLFIPYFRDIEPSPYDSLFSFESYLCFSKDLPSWKDEVIAGHWITSGFQYNEIVVNDYVYCK